MIVNQDTKIYFASDFHLGSDEGGNSRIREKRIMSWLEDVEKDATALYLLGDIFDYWFEYGQVVPKGYVGFLGSLYRIVSLGIPVYILTGNHDLWLSDYLTDQIGIKILHAPTVIQAGKKTIYLAHGDGLGPGDHTFKLTKAIFENSICQRLFSWIHPDLGISIMKAFSRRSRNRQERRQQPFNPISESAIIHSEQVLKENDKIDFFIMGHRHIPVDHVLSNDRSRYINLGDWIRHFSFAIFEGENVELRFYKAFSDD